MKKQTKGMLYTVASALIFGSVACLSPLAFAGGSSPVVLAMTRGVLASVILFFITKALHIPMKVKKGEWLQFLLLGAIGMSATVLLLSTAYLYIDIGIATTIHFSYPVFVMLASVFFFKEKAGVVKWMALVLAFAGIVLFMFGGSMGESKAALFGAAIALISGITYAFYMIFLDKSSLQHEHPFKVAFYVSVVQIFTVGIYGVCMGEFALSQVQASGWFYTVFISLASGIFAVLLLQQGIRYTDASTAAILSTFEPISSVVVGYFLLHESIGIVKIFACLLIFAGVLILSLYNAKTPVSSIPKKRNDLL